MRIKVKYRKEPYYKSLEGVTLTQEYIGKKVILLQEIDSSPVDGSVTDESHATIPRGYIGTIEIVYDRDGIYDEEFATEELSGSQLKSQWALI